MMVFFSYNFSHISVCVYSDEIFKKILEIIYADSNNILIVHYFVVIFYVNQRNISDNVVFDAETILASMCNRHQRTLVRSLTCNLRLVLVAQCTDYIAVTVYLLITCDSVAH